MKFVLLPEQKCYALTRVTEPLREVLELLFEGAAQEGTLSLHGQCFYVHKGICAIPSQALTEGENRMIYTEQTKEKSRRFLPEPLYRYGDSVTVGTLPTEELMLALLIQSKQTGGRIDALERRLCALETEYSGQNLFQ